MRKHPFIVIFERVIALLYRTDGRPHEGILDPPVDGPRQFQSGRLRSALFIRSAGHPHQANATVSVQLGSLCEPPRRIEVGKNRCRANHSNPGKITPGLDDGIVVGIGAELLLRQFHLLSGGIVADP
jgi:hypothetical protein